jgi:hypothetical protein
VTVVYQAFVTGQIRVSHTRSKGLLYARIMIVVVSLCFLYEQYVVCLDVIACVAPENNPSKAKRVHRSEIERWEIVIRQTIFFFCFNPPSSSKVSPTFRQFYPHLLLFSRSAKKHIKKLQKTHSQKAVVSSHSCVCHTILFLRAVRINKMHLVAEKSHKAVTTPSFKSHRKNVCLARPSSGSSSGFGCPFCSGPGCVVLQPPSAVCGVRSLCFPLCW